MERGPPACRGGEPAGEGRMLSGESAREGGGLN
jgi:hypothetical protein